MNQAVSSSQEKARSARILIAVNPLRSWSAFSSKAIETAEAQWLRDDTALQDASYPARIHSALAKIRGTPLTGPEKRLASRFILPRPKAGRWCPTCR